MATHLTTAVDRYVRAKAVSRGTRNEYVSTVRKCSSGAAAFRSGSCPAGTSASSSTGSTSAPGPTTAPTPAVRRTRRGNTSAPCCRGLGTGTNRHASPLPPAPRAARRGRPALPDQGGNQRPILRHALDAAPPRLDGPSPVGRYGRAALLVFFNYGIDTGTVWKSTPPHEPIRCRHVSWDQLSPDREAKERSRWGWLFYRRVKTGKACHRPMNRTVNVHLKSITPDNPRPEELVFRGGSARSNARFQAL